MVYIIYLGRTRPGHLVICIRVYIFEFCSTSLGRASPSPEVIDIRFGVISTEYSPLKARQKWKQTITTTYDL